MDGTVDVPAPAIAVNELQDKSHSDEVSDISVEDYINATLKHLLFVAHAAEMYTAPVRRYQTRPLKPRKVEDYINAPSKHPSFMPHTAGRYQARWIRKAQCPIVERPTNSLMMNKRNNGKKLSPCH